MNTRLLLGCCSLLLLAACSGTSTSAINVKWASLQTGTGSDGMPITQLTLTAKNSSTPITTQTCNGVAGTAQDVSGSLAAVRCWWAGGGDDYAAFDNGKGGIVVKHRTVDEESGIGEWQEVR